MKKENKAKMLLQKVATIALFAIALFSVMLVLPTETHAANFRYEDFEWDVFYEQNKKYWDNLCSGEETGTLKDKCEKKILKQQKKFYTRLYKLLAKYEAKEIDIDESGKDYANSFQSYAGAFKFDDSISDDSISVEPDWSGSSTALNYYKEETDTLRTLIQNMVAYDTFCYGIVGEPTKHEYYDPETDTTTIDYTCDNGGELMKLDKYSKQMCASQVGSYEKGFWEYYVSKYAHDEMLGIFQKILFFGLKFVEDNDYSGCKNYGGGYQEMYYDYTDNRRVSTYKYFEFLKNTDYYDRKAHLQEYYREDVLTPAKASCMTEELCGDKSLEAMGLYDQYIYDIFEVRSEINLYIIDILEEHEIYVDWPQGGTEEIVMMDISGQASRNGMWWPIGSSETTNEGGVTFASGDPVPTSISSPYGNRVHPIHGTVKFHHGIDIAGPQGTPIIASAEGTVVTAISGCRVGDSSCGGGYGNYVIIGHSNGDFTLYAHMKETKVSVGQTVQQGQVIGLLGTTGSSTGPHLHFEIRQGGNSSANTVDPLSIVSPDNPRPAGMSGDFSVHDTSLTKEEFMQRLADYCTKNSCNQIMMQHFVTKAGLVYDESIKNGVNPELVVVRAIVEGFSPHNQNNSFNFWGIGCYNGAGINACARYGTLEAGIAGFAKVVSGYQNASDMMSKYAYIGKYWYNPGSWSLGGCKYFPYIREFMSSGRASQVEGICAGGSCSSSGGGSCQPTTAEDQQAYATWQVNEKMSPLRYNIFGL